MLTAANAHVPMRMACRPMCVRVTAAVKWVCAGEQYVSGSEKSQFLAKGHLSVRPSVRHTRDPWLNGSRYRNRFCTTGLSDVPSFLRPNFVILSLGVHPKRVC